MTRLEQLKKLDKKGLRIAHLSKGCFLVTNKKFELKASTFEQWKQYVFSFEDAKKYLMEANNESKSI